MGVGWSIHRNNGWRGQLAGIRRWHARVVEASRVGSPDLTDFIFVFFQSCYHLREWLHHTSKIPKAEVDRFYAQTKELRLCRDICNGTKHLNIDHASVDPTFSIGWEYRPYEPSGARMFIIADDKYDMVDLAARCLELIEDFTAQDPAKVPNGPAALRASIARKRKK